MEFQKKTWCEKINYCHQSGLSGGIGFGMCVWEVFVFFSITPKNIFWGTATIFFNISDEKKFSNFWGNGKFIKKLDVICVFPVQCCLNWKFSKAFWHGVKLNGKLQISRVFPKTWLKPVESLEGISQQIWWKVRFHAKRSSQVADTLKNFIKEFGIKV